MVLQPENKEKDEIWLLVGEVRLFLNPSGKTLYNKLKLLQVCEQPFSTFSQSVPEVQGGA